MPRRKNIRDVLCQRILIDNLYGLDKEGIFVPDRELLLDFYQPVCYRDDGRLNGVLAFRNVANRFEYGGFIDNAHIFRGIFEYGRMNTLTEGEEYRKALRELSDAGFVFKGI